MEGIQVQRRVTRRQFEKQGRTGCCSVAAYRTYSLFPFLPIRHKSEEARRTWFIVFSKLAVPEDSTSNTHACAQLDKTLLLKSADDGNKTLQQLALIPTNIYF